MFANPTNVVGISQRVVATLVACAVLLWSIGVYTTAQAANLVSVSNTLSDSDHSVLSGHTIAFTIPEGSELTAGEEISITFPVGFTGVGTLVGGDISVTVQGSPGTPTNFSVNGQEITFDGIEAAETDEVVVAIADTKVTNPVTVGSYEFVISTPSDTGKTRVAIIDNVVVTAIVDTSFVFTIDGLATSSSPVVGNASTTGSTTATLIPFGTLTAGVPKSLAQQLSVTTNAMNGFVVTVESDGDLQSANGAIIDNFADGSDVAVPGTDWVAPSNDIDDRTTWGHWGLASNDSDLALPFGADNFIAASTSPRVVFAHNGPADGLEDDKGQVEVLYKIQITPLQEAADDYTTTLTYIATPTF
jgi:hypothetical protein